MASRDLVNNLSPVAGLAPAVRTTTALSAKCDTKGFESIIARFHCGTFGDVQSSSVYIEAELQESDDDSSYSAVAEADMEYPQSVSPASAIAARTGHATATFFQSKTDAADDLAGLYEVGYRGSKRYVKVNVRYTGSHSTGTPCAVSFDRGNGAFRPSNTVYPSA